MFADPDKIEYECPRCAWSDRTKYKEYPLNVWAPNEPTTHEVRLDLFDLFHTIYRGVLYF